MNKHELKSLLENIYTALTEDEGDFVGPPDPRDPMLDTPVPFLQQVLRGARPLYGPNGAYPTGTVLWDWEVPPPPPPPPKPFFIPPEVWRLIPGMIPNSPIPPGEDGNPLVPFAIT